MIKLLNKLISLIDRDKVRISSNNNNSNIEEYPITIHETVDLICDNCKAPKLYKVGYADFDYTLHCYCCDKIERVVSL